MTIDEFRRRYAYDVRTDLIGEGGFARVYKATDNVAHRTVALKFYHGDTDDKYGLLQEIRKVMRLSHINIVRFYDAILLDSPTIYDPQAKIQVGVAEYVNGGDLNDFLKTFPDEAQLSKVVRDILTGLDYLHLNGVVHRDIKPQNILLQRTNDDYTAKITDFGLAKNLESSSLSSKLMGTMEYMSPEQFDTQKFGIGGKVGISVDLWSLGVILYEMFTGDLPFGNRHEGATHEQLLFNILQKDVRSNLNNDIPEPFRSIIGRCLMRKVERRAQSARELIDLLDGNTPISPNLPLDDLATVAPLSAAEKKALFVKSLYLSPLYLWWAARQQHRQNPPKAAAIADLIWWSVPAWLAICLGALIIVLAVLYWIR